MPATRTLAPHWFGLNMPDDNAATVADSPAIPPARAADTSSQSSGPLLRLPGLPRWWRPWGPVAVDVLVALACAAFDFDFRSAFAPGEIYGPLPSWIYGWLAVLAAASLVGRRRFPVWVTGLVTAGLLLGTGSVLTVVVAYYSLGRHVRRTRTLCAVATAGLVAVVGVAALHLHRFAPGHGLSGPMATVLVLLAVGLIAVVVPVLAGLIPRIVPKQPWWWEHRRAMFFDLLLVFVFPVANPGGLLVTGASGSGGEPFLLPVPAVIALVALQGIALIWRRRRPTALTVAAIAAVPLIPPPLSTLPVCLYSLAKYGRSRRHLLLACGAAVVVLVGWTTYLTGFASRRYVPVAMFLVGLSVVVPVVFGMYRGAKRSLLISLREKAERLEREQHLLAAQARLQERTRIAREMHDVVSHRVSLMVVHAGALEAGAAGDNDVAVQTGQLIGQMGRQALNELRQVLGVLRMGDGEAALAGQPTLNDVTTLVGESRAAGMRITLDTVGDPSTVESTVQGALYRLVQEGLTNAHKHSGDAPVRVEVRRLPDAVRVIVENEAPARPATSQLPSGGHGLVGLGERVRVLGGTFEAGARPDGGFRITATIPTANTPQP